MKQAGTMVASTDGPDLPVQIVVPLGGRWKWADLWDANADERERLADRRDRALDMRVAERRDRATAAGDLDEESDGVKTLAALERAEAAVRMAEAQLVRRRLAADRFLARSNLRIAGIARSDAAQVQQRPSM